MAGNKSTYLANAIANHIAGHAAFPVPAALYVSLHSVDPTNDNTPGTELSYPGYARQSFTSGPVVDGQWSNTNDIFFPVNSGNTPVEFSFFGFYDAPVGGNLFYHPPVTATTIQPNMRMEYPPGSIEVNES